jgi:hypothetical protein
LVSVGRKIRNVIYPKKIIIKLYDSWISRNANSGLLFHSDAGCGKKRVSEGLKYAEREILESFIGRRNE